MKRDAQQLLTIAASQADALARWRRSKQAMRRAQHQRRVEQIEEPSPAPWLAAVERDRDPEEREMQLEEHAA